MGEKRISPGRIFANKHIFLFGLIKNIERSNIKEDCIIITFDIDIVLSLPLTLYYHYLLLKEDFIVITFDIVLTLPTLTLYFHYLLLFSVCNTDLSFRFF